jgi:hypothetical protein
MKKKVLIAGMVLVFLYCSVPVQAAYAGSVNGSVQIRLSSGRGHRDYGNHYRERYYQHHRRYPAAFYFRRRIYYSPNRRFYFYFDVFPEKAYYYNSESEVKSYNPDYIPVTSIANMASQGVPDAVIISEIERTRSVYKLTSEVITYLKQNNVSNRVIDVMLESGKKR